VSRHAVFYRRFHRQLTPRDSAGAFPQIRDVFARQIDDLKFNFVIRYFFQDRLRPRGSGRSPPRFSRLKFRLIRRFGFRLSSAGIPLTTRGLPFGHLAHLRRQIGVIRSHKQRIQGVRGRRRRRIKNSKPERIGRHVGSRRLEGGGRFHLGGGYWSRWFCRRTFRRSRGTATDRLRLR
jgi:hypothetical protein